MRKIIFIIVLLVVLSGTFSFAQQDNTGLLKTVGTPDATGVGKDSSQQRLVDVTIDNFEDPGLWAGQIEADFGLISVMRKQGFPARREILDKARLDADKEQNIPPGQYVLGVKVVFFRRAVIDFSVSSVRPIPIPGIAKTVSIWVVGRSFNHSVKLVLEDYFGNRNEVLFDKKLTFKGWDKLTAVIPPTLQQSEKHFTGRAGIKIVGIRVLCDLLETYGTFYMYLDDLSAVTDLFSEEARDADDILDDW
jgi:hypothetical protein